MRALIGMGMLLLLLSGDVSLAADGEDRSIRVCNTYHSRIVHIYATDRDRDDWGRDLLVGNIQPGDCRVIDPGPSRGYCIIDWRAEAKDGRWWEWRKMNACERTEWTLR